MELVASPPKPARRVALITTSRCSPIKNDATSFEAQNDANNLEKFVLRKSGGPASSSMRKSSSSSLSMVSEHRSRKRKLHEQGEDTAENAADYVASAQSATNKLLLGSVSSSGEAVRVEECRMVERELLLSVSPIKKRRRQSAVQQSLHSAATTSSSRRGVEDAALVPAIRTSPRKRQPAQPPSGGHVSSTNVNDWRMNGTEESTAVQKKHTQEEGSLEDKGAGGAGNDRAVEAPVSDSRDRAAKQPAKAVQPAPATGHLEATVDLPVAAAKPTIADPSKTAGKPRTAGQLSTAGHSAAAVKPLTTADTPAKIVKKKAKETDQSADKLSDSTADANPAGGSEKKTGDEQVKAGRRVELPAPPQIQASNYW